MRAGSANTSAASRAVSRAVRTAGKARLKPLSPLVLASKRTSGRTLSSRSLVQRRRRLTGVSAATSARAYASRKPTYELDAATVTSTVSTPSRARLRSTSRTSDDLP